MFSSREIKEFSSFLEKNNILEEASFKRKNPILYNSILNKLPIDNNDVFFIMEYKFKHFKNNIKNGKIKEDVYSKVFRCKRGKKYRNIIQKINDLNLTDRYCSIMNLIVAQKLIKMKINRDLVYNSLLKNLKTKKVIKNIPTDKEIQYLFNIYGDSRMIYLLMESSFEDTKFYLSEINKLKADVEENFSNREIREYKIFSKKPKSLKYIHDRIVSKLEEKRQFKDIDNFKLKPREDLLKLHGKTISFKDKEWKVFVARDKIDLVKFSQSSNFSNCVGTSSSYGESARKGDSTILGIFSKEDRPLYCIQTTKYCFKQALGVGNTQIPKNIYNALQNLLTVKPEVPEDFIELKHSFVYGYKYNPEESILYIMFKNSGIYEYNNVSKSVYEEFSSTEYKGRYLNQVLKDSKKYPYERVA